MKALLVLFLLAAFSSPVSADPEYGYHYYGSEGAKVPPRKPGEPRRSCFQLYSMVTIPAVEQRKALANLEFPRSQTTDEFRARYKDYEQYAYYGRDTMRGQNNTPANFLRFVQIDDYIASPTRRHGVETYGVGNFTAWTKADEYLKSIPVGKFEPSLEVFSKTHELASGSLFPRLKALTENLPGGYIPNRGGVLKQRDSVGKYPLTHPLTEEQFEAIKANPWLSGFIELPSPMSKPGARRGWIKYGEAEETERLLKDLVKWYNANKDTMDPVELAARFQHAFVSIHPFVDGNGRTSRLLMDRILAEHGLPPSILRDSNLDILLPPEKHVQNVREGLDRFLAITQHHGATQSVPRNDLDNGLHIMEKIMPHTHRLPPGPVSFGGKRFEFSTMDGFLYDAGGVPHIYRDGALHPISDRTYRMLEMNLPSEIKVDTHHIPATQWGPSYTYQTQRLVTGDNPIHVKYTENNIEFLAKIKAGELDPASVKVEPYSVIEKANTERTAHIYPWQRELVEHAARIDSSNPENILMPFRNGKTFFDINPQARKQPSHILAQYEMVDNYYYDLEKLAKEQFPDLLPKVQESRRKLHTAARQLMEPMLKDLEGLSKEAREIAVREPAMRLFNTYLKHSKLNTASYEIARRNTNDDYITLMRSDSTAVNYTGFISHADFTKAFTALPGSNKLREMLERLSAFMQSPEGRRRVNAMIKIIQGKAAKGESIYKYLPEPILAIIRDLEKYYSNLQQAVHYAVDTLFKNKYSIHSAGPEFERAFVQDLAHGQGHALKTAKSFTTNSNLMESFPFAHSTGEFAEPQISFVRMPKRQANIQFGTDGFSNEYEILAVGPVGPWRIQDKVTKSQLTSTLEGVGSLYASPAQIEAGQFLYKYFEKHYVFLPQPVQ